MRPERPGRPDWRPDDRRDRRYWRPDRDHRPRWDRYRPPRYYPDRWRDRYWYDRPRSGIYFNYYVDRYPGYYDDDYYVEPQPAVPLYRGRLSAAHIEWCYARYKTYRASDNTFKPTRHTRRQCISPYS